MSPHEHAWLLARQVGPVRLERCSCGAERRGARAFFGRGVYGPITFAGAWR